MTVKNDAVLGCFGNSTRPSVSRANFASVPRTMRPSLGLGIGLRASGMASAGAAKAHAALDRWPLMLVAFAIFAIIVGVSGCLLALVEFARHVLGLED